MRAKDIGFNFFLEADKIDLASEKIMDFLQQLALEHREALRIQLIFCLPGRNGLENLRRSVCPVTPGWGSR